MNEQDCARCFTPENVAEKRPRTSPTLQTPCRPAKRMPLREKVLNSDSAVVLPQRILHQPRNQATPKDKWSDAEIKALIEFVLFHSTGDKWPSHKQDSFWSCASDYLRSRSGDCSVRRSGSACRFKVIGWLAKKYKTPKEAESLFHSSSTQLNSSSLNNVSCVKKCKKAMCASTQTDDMDVTTIVHCYDKLSADLKLEMLSKLFTSYMLSNFCLLVPDDFLSYTAKAMVKLKGSERTNVLYNLAKGIGTPRVDNSGSRFPTDRMPMGLVEYTASFYANDDLQKISCPLDYRLWQQTMYSQFGQKWSRLHNGPMWSVASKESSDCSHSQATMKALVNIPGLSERMLRRDIASCEITLDSQIQTSVLDEAARSNPNAWWWLKADGCDLVKGLKESVKLQWSGDVDLNDGYLHKQYDEYKKRLERAEKAGLVRESACAELKDLLKDVAKDLEFIQLELKRSNDTYSSKFQSEKYKEKELIKLAWKIKELSELDDIGRKCYRDVEILICRIDRNVCSWQDENVPKKLKSIRQTLVNFIKGVTRHQRTAATHILIFMISNEERRTKPYALPVQCIPYVGLSDSKVRQLANNIIHEMTDRNMKVAGFTTDGEWSTLRTKGNHQPLSIFQIRSDARAKYARMKLQKMTKMITPLRAADGKITACIPNLAVDSILLEQVHSWIEAGATIDDAIERLRAQTVPPGYIVHSWIEGKDESKVEKLRSILAQLEYKYQINHWNSNGIPFKDHLYVAEVHPVTGIQFCEREDEGHIFKRIGQSLRQGGHADIQLERFEEALHDPSAGLTYTALSGMRKQSVEDVERLFSDSIVKWMEKNGYDHEATYLRVIRNWRCACDERGLSAVQRSQFNNDFLNYILDDLMPWHKQEGLRDFSLLEVNRNVSNVRGFTREILVAVMANIESREWRKQYLIKNNIPMEHPRASTTDDVECFFSVLRDMVGKDFTLKEVLFGWRKVTYEFAKRMDPDLPFYYHTSTHHRFYEGEMPDFNTKPKKTPQPRRTPRYELLGADSRVTFAVRNSGSIRAMFHNAPVELPPPPGTYNQLHHEHTYAASR